MRIAARDPTRAKLQPRLVTAESVYFIGWEGGPVKIGVSRSPVVRLYEAQTFCPYPLKVFAVCNGGPVQERIYHKRFAARRLNGEWFERCPEIEAEIARLNAKEPTP
jgi:hypothetical protein